MSVMIERKIYDHGFFDKVRSALKLQGKVPDRIATDVRLTVVGNPKNAAQWTIPRPFKGILKRQYVARTTAGKETFAVPDGKLWELVGLRVGSRTGSADADTQWDLLEIDGNTMLQFYADSGDTSRMPLAADKEHIIVGGNCGGQGPDTILNTPYSIGSVVTKICNFFKAPVFVRDELTITWYGTFADTTAYTVLWYYERNIEDWEKVTRVNR